MMVAERPRQISPSASALLLGPLRGRESAVLALKEHGYAVVTTELTEPISTQLHSVLLDVDVVIVDVTTINSSALGAIQDISSAMVMSGTRASLLCFSSVHRNPRFVLALEKCDARYVRISNLAMLLDAIEVVIARAREIQLNGPCFRIIHGFSRGTCAPGEEITAIQFAHDGSFLQLPLALPQRLAFDFLGQHRRIALDSSQIATGLGDWFYREHALNGGKRQVIKIRPASVKVLVRRIRSALSATFARANVKYDPREVLRSFPAEGSNKVLYKLHADVHWDHPFSSN